MSSLTYKPIEKCPKCGTKTHLFSTMRLGCVRHWIEFCLNCGWFKFIERPKGQEMVFLQIHGVNATDDELRFINEVLKNYEEGAEGILKLR